MRRAALRLRVSGFFSKLGVLLFCGASAFAQTTTGSISGIVSDPASAVVPGAKVEVVNEATGGVTPLVTNDAGLYRAAFLVPGLYRVRIQASGPVPLPAGRLR